LWWRDVYKHWDCGIRMFGRIFAYCVVKLWGLLVVPQTQDARTRLSSQMASVLNFLIHLSTQNIQYIDWPHARGSQFRPFSTASRTTSCNHSSLTPTQNCLWWRGQIEFMKRFELHHESIFQCISRSGNPITGLDTLWAFQEVQAPRFQENRHMKAVRLSAPRTGRLYPMKYSWYSFLLEAESTPGPKCGWKDYVNEKFQWYHRESNPRFSAFIDKILKQQTNQSRSVAWARGEGEWYDGHAWQNPRKEKTNMLYEKLWSSVIG
jgi:hypothetical protein